MSKLPTCEALLTRSQNDLCETTDGVRSYSGYVHLPAGALADLGVQNQTYELLLLNALDETK